MFINDIPKRESVEREIGALSADYVARIEGNALSASEMILGCRRILNLWIDGSGSSLDGEVIGVLASKVSATTSCYDQASESHASRTMMEMRTPK